jgi:hypothetical protein
MACLTSVHSAKDAGDIAGIYKEGIRTDNRDSIADSYVLSEEHYMVRPYKAMIRQLY